MNELRTYTEADTRVLAATIAKVEAGLAANPDARSTDIISAEGRAIMLCALADLDSATDGHNVTIRTN